MFCRDERRRSRVRGHTDAEGRPDLNGIDYVEYQAPADDDPHAVPTLVLHLFSPAPTDISAVNVRVDGGVRISVMATYASPRPDDDGGSSRQIEVRLDQEGDFSPYTVRLVEPDAYQHPGETPLTGFDPRYASETFSFKVDCPSDLDCATQTPCPPEPVEEPDINYLAKDYASFRRLVLDRLALDLPDWTEDNPADLGITLVEMLAYVGDHLSYLQDAVATEAYLNTARQRISVRRHTRLVDYRLHDGCNARAWVCLQVSRDLEDRDLGGLQLLTASSDAFTGPEPLVFEPVAAGRVSLYRAHNTIYFYTWGNAECCLPKGATSATLWAGLPAVQPVPPASPYGESSRAADPVAHRMAGTQRHEGPRGPLPHTQDPEEPARAHYPLPPPPGTRGQGDTSLELRLEPGDVLIFEEVIGPKTGDSADADHRHRHVVRLTSVTPGCDPLDGTAVMDVTWAQEDRLPFALCLSTVIQGPPDAASLRSRIAALRDDLALPEGARSQATPADLRLLVEPIVAFLADLQDQAHSSRTRDELTRVVAQAVAELAAVRQVRSILGRTRRGGQSPVAPAVASWIDLVVARLQELTLPVCRLVTDVSVAHGNAILVDHGETAEERLEVPGTSYTDACAGEGQARVIAAKPKPFETMLAQTPLTHRAPFPDPAQVSRSQARALDEMLAAVRAYVPGLIARLRSTGRPLEERDRSTLRALFLPELIAFLNAARRPLPQSDENLLCVLFGEEEIGEYGVAAGGARPAVDDTLDDEIEALSRLLGYQERLLAARSRRVRVLVGRLRAGHLLSTAEAREIVERFGDAFAVGLDPGHPRWSGPAAGVLVQDPRLGMPVVSLRQFGAGDVDLPAFCDAPSWATLVREQRQILGGLAARVLAKIDGLMHRIETEETALMPHELDVLRVLFGERVLAEVRLPGPGHPLSHVVRHQIQALQRLKERQEEYLEPKLERLGELLGYLSRGDVLIEDEVLELVAMFGPELVQGDPPKELRGPEVVELDVWCPRLDLLGSQGDEHHFVVEIDDEGIAHLRFGDGELGAAAPPGARFRAAYRVGNGAAGNVGSEAIRVRRANPLRVIDDDIVPSIDGVRNPLPASGGIEPEPIAGAKLYAPGTFRKAQLRAVSEDDYARLAGMYPGVQKAVARFRWTGSWVEVSVAIDALDTEDISAGLLEGVFARLEPYRRIGHELRVVPATYVGVVLGLTVDVLPHYLRGQVESALLDVFSNTLRQDGRPGFFHPNNLTFGGRVELSRMIAAAQAVAGVRNVRVTRFLRAGDRPAAPPAADPAVSAGLLQLGPLEIPRLDNDPNFPGHGRLELTMRGGR
jgi:hypothetical protein